MRDRYARAPAAAVDLGPPFTTGSPGYPHREGRHALGYPFGSLILSDQPECACHLVTYTLGSADSTSTQTAESPGVRARARSGSFRIGSGAEEAQLSSSPLESDALRGRCAPLVEELPLRAGRSRVLCAGPRGIPAVRTPTSSLSRARAHARHGYSTPQPRLSRYHDDRARCGGLRRGATSAPRIPTASRSCTYAEKRPARCQPRRS